MLENEKLIPRELILLARSMRMIQANNQVRCISFFVVKGD